MAAPVGSLLIELAASTAKLQTDFNRAVSTVESGAKRMQGALRSAIGGFVGGLVGILSIRAFVGAIQGAIDYADRLNDLSQSTGIAVEDLGGLGFAAKKTGSDLEGVAKGINRLNLQIAAAKGGNAESIKTFQALGVSVAELKTLGNDETLFRVADRFAEWGDGANKAQVASRLFGKSFAEMVPFLNQGGQELRTNIEYFKKYSNITAEVARRADEFNDTIEKVNLLHKGFAMTLANELLPTLDRVAEAYVEAAEGGNIFKEAAEQIAVVVRGLAASGVVISGIFQGIGKSLGVTAAQMVAIVRGEFAIARQLGQEFEAENSARVARQSKLLDALMNPGAGGAPRTPRARRPDAPGIADSGAVSDANALAKRILDGQIKALNDSIRDENDLLKVREEFLRGYFNDDLIAFADYFQTRQDLVRDNLAKQVAALNEEERLLISAQGRKGIKPAEFEELENKRAAVTRNRAKVEQEAAFDSIRLFREQEREAQKFRDTIEGVAIELARMSGDTAIAAIASFDIQHRALQKLIDTKRTSLSEEERREAALAQKQLDGLRARTAAQASLNEMQNRFGLSLDRLQTMEGRIALERASGAISEVQALQKVSDAHKAILPALEAEAEAMARVVAETGSPEAIQNLENIRLKIAQLVQETDLAGDKFRGVFRESFTDALADFANGTKTAKEAFKSFADSVVQQMNRIAAQQLSEALFGGAKGGSGGTGAIGGLIGDFFKGIFGGGYAMGGFPPVGKISMVGEQGREFILPRSPVQVIPNHALGSIGGKSVTVVNHFAITGPVDSRTQSQIAREVGMAAQRAISRDA